jgi:hypothetical protein
MIRRLSTAVRVPSGNSRRRASSQLPYSACSASWRRAAPRLMPRGIINRLNSYSGIGPLCPPCAVRRRAWAGYFWMAWAGFASAGISSPTTQTTSVVGGGTQRRAEVPFTTIRTLLPSTISSTSSVTQAFTR